MDGEIPADRANGFYFSTRRISAMVLRYFYLLRGSLPRIVELAYWPTMQMLIWGFMSQFLHQHSEWFAQAGVIALYVDEVWPGRDSPQPNGLRHQTNRG